LNRIIESLICRNMKHRNVKTLKVEKISEIKMLMLKKCQKP
jgi:hypothetical protein